MKHEIGLTYGMGGVSGESFELPDGTVIQDSDVANCHQVLFHPELLGEHNILIFYILMGLPIHMIPVIIMLVTGVLVEITIAHKM